MANWSLEVYEEGYIIIRGAVPIKEFQLITNRYCERDWVVDMQQAEENDATFFMCKKELCKEPEKHAVNQ